MRMSKIRHQYAIFDAILTPSGKFPRHFWLLGDICRLRRLTFCWRFVLIRSYMQKKPAVKTAVGTCLVAYWWRRWDAWGDMREDTNITGADTESDFWLIIYSMIYIYIYTYIWRHGGSKLRRFQSPCAIFTIRVNMKDRVGRLRRRKLEPPLAAIFGFTRWPEDLTPDQHDLLPKLSIYLNCQKSLKIRYGLNFRTKWTLDNTMRIADAVRRGLLVPEPWHVSHKHNLFIQSGRDIAIGVLKLPASIYTCLICVDKHESGARRYW